MRLALAGILCAAIAAVPAIAAGPRATVELLPQVNVRAGTVVLGQVALLKSEDLNLLRRLVHLPVGRSPRLGEGAVLQRDGLASWIRQQAGIGADMLDWRGPGETRVLHMGAQVRGEEIARAAMDALRARLAVLGMSSQVDVRLMPRDIDVPLEDVRLEVRRTGNVRQHMVLWVDVWSGGAFIRTVPVSIELAGGKVPPEIVPRARHASGPAADTFDASEENEQGPLAVSRGNWATLRTVAGPVTLEGRVEVMQDGRAGQKVRVRPQGATGFVFGRVVGRGQLELAP
jgi:flagella basal body P-ring formation protein FlgA